MYSFPLLKHECHMALGQSHCYICSLWGGDRVLLLQPKMDLLETRDWRLTPTTGVDPVLFLLCVSRALFHPGLCCVSLASLLPRHKWAKVLRCLFSVVGNKNHCSSLKINNITNQGRKGWEGEENSVSCCLRAGERNECLNQDTEMKNEEMNTGLKTV